VTVNDDSPALAGLSSRQREAVLAVDGPVLVLAGAGSGKTKVITHRIAHLIADRQVPASSILAVTFTNKAADEMQARAIALVGEAARGCRISTFHSFCVRVLRRDGPRIGLKREFVIFDDGDQLGLMREILRDLNVSERLTPPRRALSWISRGKNRGTLAEAPEEGEDAGTLGRIAAEYQRRLDARAALDFDDLLLKTAQLFVENGEAREAYRRRFPYVLVDEYQDTNRPQYEIVQNLVGEKGNVTVVGDEDQSIYSWRGADINNILAFESDFPGARIIRLEDNYRSTQVILDAAGALVAHNVRRKGKVLKAQRPAGEPVVVRVAADEFDEAAWVAQQAGAARGKGRVAVLCRMNAQSRLVEESLLRAGLPYVVVGGLAFYARKEIKDVMAYLRLLLNPRDLASFRRIANVPARGLGERTIEPLCRLVESRGVDVWEAAAAAIDGELLSTRAVPPVQRFVDLLSALRREAEVLSPRAIIERVLAATEYARYLSEDDPASAEERLENVAELVAAAADFEAREPKATLPGFIDRVSLLSSADEKTAAGAVSLLTLHAAKGLEFETVLLIGVEEGLLPHGRNLDKDEALEEERRLCYVGMTRARDRLLLSWAQSRQVFGRRSSSRPSRFLAEIRSHGGRLSQVALPARAASTPITTERQPSGSGGLVYRPGLVVRHALFGSGTVLRVDGQGEDAKLTVSFSMVGTKRLVARFAGLVLD
jgi:DNA helicase II / ATP-dependent DNA helicase PcrA